MKRLVLAAMLALTGCHKVIVVSDGLNTVERIDLPRSLTYVGSEMLVTNGVFEVKLNFIRRNNDKGKD